MDAYKIHRNSNYRKVAADLHEQNPSPEDAELLAKAEANEDAIPAEKTRALSCALCVENPARVSAKLRNHNKKHTRRQIG